MGYPISFLIRRLARPDLFSVLARCYSRTTLERTLEGNEIVEAHVIGDVGNGAIIGLYAPLGVINSQYGEPTVKTYPNFLMKKGAEISVL